jgi:hypothetical protein
MSLQGFIVGTKGSHGTVTDSHKYEGHITRQGHKMIACARQTIVHIAMPSSLCCPSRGINLPIGNFAGIIVGFSIATQVNVNIIKLVESV